MERETQIGLRRRNKGFFPRWDSTRRGPKQSAVSISGHGAREVYALMTRAIRELESNRGTELDAPTARDVVDDRVGRFTGVRRTNLTGGIIGRCAHQTTV